MEVLVPADHTLPLLYIGVPQVVLRPGDHSVPAAAALVQGLHHHPLQLLPLPGGSL